jgi:hypothetical protein
MHPYRSPRVAVFATLTRTAQRTKVEQLIVTARLKIILHSMVAIALSAPLGAVAQTSSNQSPSSTADELQTLRQELTALRADYETRLQALESRLQAAENSSVQAAAPSASSAQNAATGGANAFNPAMSLILSGGYTRTSVDPQSFHIAGFQLPTHAEAGPGSRGFSLAESELGLAANIDPWLRGAANIALESDDTVSIEEAYVQTTSLGEGLSIKGGRFLSSIGYLNSQHSHTWDFVDNPLAYQALLGTQYGDDGVQLSWLAPTDQYVELTAELGRGRSYPGSDTGRNGAGMVALTLHTGGDIGDSSSWRAGISSLHVKANDQELTMVDDDSNVIDNSFSGTTEVWLVDGVWKWAPHGNATRTNFKLQGEYLRSRRHGDLTYDLGGADLTDNYRVTQSGWYVQGVYQFMPHWRAGLRTERLDIGTTDFGEHPDLLTFNGDAPRKHSVMLDYSPSEFSRVRLQFARDYSRSSVADNQAFLQYQMSLGAHGAHVY